MQEMVIYGVSFDMVGKQPIVLLKTIDGNKFLPIWIGHPEAAAILMKLQGATTPRPMTHDLISDMISELDATCTRVAVTELKENTFFASITLRVNGQEVEIDSRPSDALAVAVRMLGADLRRRGGHPGERDRVRARGRGHRGGRRQVQEVPRRGDARGLRLRQPARAAGARWSGQRGVAGRASASSTSRSISCSNDMPAASAACGSRLVSVSPGIACASSTCELAVVRQDHVDARESVAAEQPVDGDGELLRLLA